MHHTPVKKLLEFDYNKRLVLFWTKRCRKASLIHLRPIRQFDEMWVMPNSSPIFFAINCSAVNRQRFEKSAVRSRQTMVLEKLLSYCTVYQVMQTQAVYLSSSCGWLFLVLKNFWFYSLSASYGDCILIHTILAVYSHFEQLTNIWLVWPPFSTIEHLGGFVWK